MVKTVPFDVPASFAIGMLIALVSAKGIKSSGNLMANRYFIGTAMFEAFFFIPLGAYLYFFYTDWSLMYFVNPIDYAPDVVRTIGLVSLAVYFLSAVGGFLLAAYMIRRGKDSTARITLLSVLAALAIFSAFTTTRLISVGTYADWSAASGTTTFLWSHHVGWIIGIDATIAGAVLTLMLRAFRRQAVQA